MTRRRFLTGSGYDYLVNLLSNRLAPDKAWPEKVAREEGFDEIAGVFRAIGEV